MKFSEQVKHTRKVLHLTQQQLAEALGVSFATINRWENSRVRPSGIAVKVFFDFCENNFVEFSSIED